MARGVAQPPAGDYAVRLLRLTMHYYMLPVCQQVGLKAIIGWWK